MKQIISISRRTDIISFHFDWLIDILKKGRVDVENPINHKYYNVSLLKEDIHTLVLWSKNFENFLNNKEKFEEYNLYFHFTVNLYSKRIEPYVIDWINQKKQIKMLAELYGSNCITLRFDPIMFDTIFMTLTEAMEERLDKFKKICSFLYINKLNIRIVTSYIDVNKRNKKYMEKMGVIIYQVSKNELIYFFGRMKQIADKYKIELSFCCEENLADSTGIKKSSCINYQILSENAGFKCTTANDTSQRKECGCIKSRDIGNYFTEKKGQICQHGCVYCYARKD